MKVFKNFFVTGKFVRSLNTTFRVMVPKRGGGGGGGEGVGLSFLFTLLFFV